MSFFNNLTEMANNMIVRLAPTDDTTNESPEINTSLLPNNQPQSSLRINTGGVRRRTIQPGEKRKGRHLKKICKFCGVAYYTSYLSRHMAKFCPVGEQKSAVERQLARKQAKIVRSAKKPVVPSSSLSSSVSSNLQNIQSSSSSLIVREREYVFIDPNQPSTSSQQFPSYFTPELPLPQLPKLRPVKIPSSDEFEGVNENAEINCFNTDDDDIGDEPFSETSQCTLESRERFELFQKNYADPMYKAEPWMRPRKPKTVKTRTSGFKMICEYAKVKSMDDLLNVDRWANFFHSTMLMKTNQAKEGTSSHTQHGRVVALNQFLEMFVHDELGAITNDEKNKANAVKEILKRKLKHLNVYRAADIGYSKYKRLTENVTILTAFKFAEFISDWISNRIASVETVPRILFLSEIVVWISALNGCRPSSIYGMKMDELEQASEEEQGTLTIHVQVCHLSFFFFFVIGWCFDRKRKMANRLTHI